MTTSKLCLLMSRSSSNLTHGVPLRGERKAKLGNGSSLALTCPFYPCQAARTWIVKSNEGSSNRGSKIPPTCSRGTADCCFLLRADRSNLGKDTLEYAERASGYCKSPKLLTPEGAAARLREVGIARNCNG